MFKIFSLRGPLAGAAGLRPTSAPPPFRTDPPVGLEGLSPPASPEAKWLRKTLCYSVGLRNV